MAALIKSPVLRGESLLLSLHEQAAPRPEAAVQVKEAAHPGANIRDNVSGFGVEAKDLKKAAATAFVSDPAVPDRGQESPAEMQARLEATQSEMLSAIREEARRQGYADGFAKGESAGEARLQKIESTLVRLIESIQAAVADTIASSEEIVGALVFEAASKIVGGQLVTREGAASVVEQVVARAKREEIVIVKVSADDYARLQSPERKGSVLSGLALEQDSRVELGGCIVQLRGGHLDGRIEAQFREFAQSIKEAVHPRD